MELKSEMIILCPRCETRMDSQKTTPKDQTYYCPKCKTVICNGNVIRG